MPKDVKCWTKPKVAGGTYTTCVDKEGNQLSKKPQMNIARKGKAKPKPAKKPTMPKVIPKKPRVPKIPVVFNVGKPKKPPKIPSWPTVIPPRKPKTPLIPKEIGVKERFKVWGISVKRDIQEWWIQHDTRKEHSSTLGISPYGVGSHKWSHVYKKEKGGEPVGKVINWWDGIVKNVRNAGLNNRKDEEWKMYDSKRKAEIELDQMEEKEKPTLRLVWGLPTKGDDLVMYFLDMKTMLIYPTSNPKFSHFGKIESNFREDKPSYTVATVIKYKKLKIGDLFTIYLSKEYAEERRLKYKTPKPEFVPKKPKPNPNPRPRSPSPEPASGGGGEKIPLKKILRPTEIAGDLLEYSKGEPVDFACYNRISIYLFLEVMRRNKNDCILGFEKFRNWSAEAGYFMTLEELRKDSIKQMLMEKYEECAKNNKIFCMPIFKSNHANMLVFNHHLNQLEYYEPHGTATAPFTSAIKKVVKYFNKYAKSKLSPAHNLKYSDSEETCPNFSPEIIKEWNAMRIYIREQKKWDKKGKAQNLKSGLQILEHRGTEEQQKQRGTTARGRIFKDTAGYCCMWSFLHMDYRLKNPTLPPNQLATELTALARKNPREFFRNYIRGYTDDIFQTLIAKIGRENLHELNKRTTSAISGFNQVVNQMYKDASGNKLF